MSEPKFIADMFDELQRNIDERERKYQERLASDPEFARREREREERRLAREAEEKAEAERQAALRARVSLSTMGIPGKDIDALLAMQDGVSALRETAALNITRGWWDSDCTVLVLSGTRGCGKTTAAAWAVAQEPQRSAMWEYDSEQFFRGHPRANRPRGAMFIDVSKLQRASRYDEEQMASIEYAATLAIDDLGMEYADAKGSFMALFDGLFNTRYAERLKTVITTNLTAADFKARYGERVADRIRECGRFVELSEQSLRGGK